MEPQRPSTHDLLDDYLALSVSLPQLAKRHNLSLSALIAFLDNPETQRILDGLRRHAARRAGDASIHARAIAIDTLVLHATSDPASESARRAATELLRDRVRTHRRRRAPQPPSADHAEAPTTRPRKLPSDLRAALRLAHAQQRKRKLGIPLTPDDHHRAAAMAQRLATTHAEHTTAPPARASPSKPRA